MSRSLQEAIAEDLIENEHYRARDLKRSGKFAWTCDDVFKPDGARISEAEKLAVLAEEFGEVSREVVEEIIANDCGGGSMKKHREKLLKELVQVAAVALSWIEEIRYHAPERERA